MLPGVGTNVPVAAVAIASDTGTLTALGLGSCIAVMLHDPIRRIGAMAHVLLPDESLSRDRGNPARFATTAIPHLVSLLQSVGASDAIVARLAGGASMFAALGNRSASIGERNAMAAKAALRSCGIPLVGEDLGGTHGRSVYFDVATGEACVVSLHHRSRVL
jgi:chemotaxis protein CheD